MQPLTTEYHCPEQLPPQIFRRYDIRGRVDSELNENTYYALGLAIATLANAQGEQAFVVGRDGRHQSPAYAKALMAGLQQAGMRVLDVGLVPTPLLYFATHHTGVRSGLMITGSHNPKDYNGLKVVLAGKTLSAEGIQQIAEVYVRRAFVSGEGSLECVDVIEPYIDYVAKDIQLQRPMKIVIDAGNGAAAEVAPRLFKRLGCEVDCLYCDIDGDFPNHHPDPSVEANLQDLIKRVQAIGADGGLALDGDGDRLGVVTNAGEVVWPDQQMMFYAASVLSDHPGETIVFDVKCSKHLAEWIRQHGGEPLMWQTGHSILKAKMFDVQAPLAGELSGHIFFNDKRWFGFDDGMYAGARWLEIMSQDTASQSERFATLPQAEATPEIKVAVNPEQKDQVLEALRQYDFVDATVIDIDGVRVEYADGWALVRASHTTPCLTVRFEADNAEALDRIQSQFRQLLKTMLPEDSVEF